jgi:hypothetical protein
VTPEVIEVIGSKSDQLNVPALVRAVKEHTGISLSQSHVRRLAHDHRPARVELQLFDCSTNEGSGNNATEEAGVEHDDGAKVSSTVASSAFVEPDVREGDPFEAYNFDPPVAPPEHVRGRYMGLALYFPAIEALGVVAAARQSFSLPRSVIFGVRAVTLSLLS